MRVEKKFNDVRDNITPDCFMAAPTMILKDQTKAAALEVVERLTHQTNLLRPSESRKLKVGTEVEVLFFSPDADPSRPARSRYGNPNYLPKHELKMDEIRGRAADLTGKGNFDRWSSTGRLGIEFRTLPSTAHEYLETVETLKEEVATLAEDLDVLPYVHSQHIHVSLMSQRENQPINVLAEKFKKDFSVGDWAKLRSFFSRIAPLVQQPDESFNEHYLPAERNNTLGDCDPEPLRVEFRLLSSEWAVDPIINLLVSLMGLDDELTPTTRPDPEFSTGNYRVQAIRLGKDPVLQQVWGHSLTRDLSDLTQQYPLVTDGKIMAKEIKPRKRLF